MTNYKTFTQSELSTMLKEELISLRDFIQTGDYPVEVKDKNIDEINIALNGGVKYTNKNALELIKMVEPDCSDMQGIH